MLPYAGDRMGPMPGGGMPLGGAMQGPMGQVAGPPPVGMAQPSLAPNPGNAMRFGIPDVPDRSNVNAWRMR